MSRYDDMMDLAELQEAIVKVAGYPFEWVGIRQLGAFSGAAVVFKRFIRTNAFGIEVSYLYLEDDVRISIPEQGKSGGDLVVWRGSYDELLKLGDPGVLGAAVATIALED